MAGVEERQGGIGTLADEAAVGRAAEAVADGDAVVHGFANFYALTARGDAAVVERVNVMKGRPAGQVGSATTTPDRILSLFDWSLLPSVLPRQQVRSLVRELFALGPYGVRGPAAATVPDHLTSVQDGVRTVQVIAPGHACPSNAFLSAALERAGADLLFITSANRSRQLTGADHEPAHWRAAGVAADFGGEAGVRVLAHADEGTARARYPHHEPMSTSVLSFHRSPGHGPSGLPALTLERHGSLSADHTRSLAAVHGFALITERAGQRLTARVYGPRTPEAPSV
ncbi:MULTISPECIES: hypothetical protein [Streptomyces]|uniref:hypothetical protein n=1 Tax=Streptomyces TaxID=1883 RepID=UPI0006EB55C4|nr:MULTISPECIES: hypothetical protein [Streptomyces]